MTGIKIANNASSYTQRKMQHARSQSDASAPITALEFLAFTMSDEKYGIDIQKMQEIRGYDTVTRIANSFNFIKDMVNLRGVIVPIIDMRLKFSFGSLTDDRLPVVIINIPDLIIGLGTLDDRALILVDTDNLMSSTEMALITETVH